MQRRRDFQGRCKALNSATGPVCQAWLGSNSLVVRESLFLDKANILLRIRHSVRDNNSDLNGALLVLECNRRGKVTAAERKLHFHSKM